MLSLYEQSTALDYLAGLSALSAVWLDEVPQPQSQRSPYFRRRAPHVCLIDLDRSVEPFAARSDHGAPQLVQPGPSRLVAHQGAVSDKHLDYYLNEYAFRFNRHTSRSRGMLFYRLMQQAVATASVLYRQLVDGKYKM